MRKTIDVAKVKARANRALNNEAALNAQKDSHGVHGAACYRQGVIGVLEDVLESTGNYRGFRFTDNHRGELDSTRREYY